MKIDPSKFTVPSIAKDLNKLNTDLNGTMAKGSSKPTKAKVMKLFTRYQAILSLAGKKKITTQEWENELKEPLTTVEKGIERLEKLSERAGILPKGLLKTIKNDAKGKKTLTEEQQQIKTAYKSSSLWAVFHPLYKVR